MKDYEITPAHVDCISAMQKRLRAWQPEKLKLREQAQPAPSLISNDEGEPFQKALRLIIHQTMELLAIAQKAGKMEGKNHGNWYALVQELRECESTAKPEMMTDNPRNKTCSNRPGCAFDSTDFSDVHRMKTENAVNIDSDEEGADLSADLLKFEQTGGDVFFKNLIEKTESEEATVFTFPVQDYYDGREQGCVAEFKGHLDENIHGKFAVRVIVALAFFALYPLDEFAEVGAPHVFQDLVHHFEVCYFREAACIHLYIAAIATTIGEQVLVSPTVTDSAFVPVIRVQDSCT